MPSSIFSDIDPGKYMQALQVIRERDGMLPDDTYLEKMITTTVEKLRACGNPVDKRLIYVEWGLQSFVADVLTSLPEVTSPLHEFALKLLRQCCSTEDPWITEEAKRISENLLQAADDQLVVEPSPPPLLAAAPMLDLLAALQDVYLSPWSESVRLWERVLLPLWKHGMGDDRSMFWEKSFYHLNFVYLVGLVMWTIKQSDTTENAECNKARVLGVLNQLVLLSGSNEGIIRNIFPTLLRSLYVHARNLQPKEKAALKQLMQPTSVLFEADDFQQNTAECQVLFWALKNSDKLVINLTRAFIAWRSNESMLPILKTLPFVHKRLNLSTALEPLMDRMQRNGLKGEGFSNAYFVCKFMSKVIATDDTVKVSFLNLVIEYVGLFRQEAEVYSSMSNVVAEKTLDCLLVTLENCLQVGLSNFGKEWEVLTGLCVSSHVKDDQKCLALNVMRKLLSQSSLTDTKLPLGASFADMWAVFCGPCHWGLTDSFLVLLGQVFKTWIVGDDFSTTLVQQMLLTSLGSANAFLRATALETMAAMVPHARLWNNFPDLGELATKYLVLETEATVRRNCAEFLRQFFSAEYGNVSSTSVKDCMTLAMSDLDCETKEYALLFWKDLITVEVSRYEGQHGDPNVFLDALDASDITTALTIAMRDYDVIFLRKLCPVISDVKVILMGKEDTLEPVCKKAKLEEGAHFRPSDQSHISNNIPSKDVTSVARKTKDDVIMDIVNTNDSEILEKNRLPITNIIAPINKVSRICPSDFLLELSKFQVKPVTKHLDDYFDLHLGLSSIVADVIQSVSDSNAIDVIDCV